MEKLPLKKPKPPNIKGYEITPDKGRLRITPKKPLILKKQKEYQAKKKEEDFFDLKFVKGLI
jgi:hypothetical protein